MDGEIFGSGVDGWIFALKWWPPAHMQDLGDVKYNKYLWIWSTISLAW